MTRSAAMAGSGRVRRVWRRVVVAIGALPVALALLFAWNGLLLGHGTAPVAGVVDSEHGPTATGDRRIRVLAWNLAKCQVYRSGLSFARREEVEARLRRIAAVIRSEGPDLVFLSEVVVECTPCDVDQVRTLARATGLRYWAFGENYCFGLPFLRIVGGNAILSRQPLEPVANPDLAGRRAFWITRNNRRVLLCRTTLGSESILLGAIHTDSFDPANNLRQTAQILAFDPAAPTLLAGDFNAAPDSPSIAAIADSGRFAGPWDGPPTFPAESPQVRIDSVFAPAAWQLVDSRVLDDTTSDHRPVVATFERRG